jgi:hypothetical protein
VLATTSLRDHVRDLIKDRATSGLVIALSDTPAPGARDDVAVELLRETEALFPGGALISGSYPPYRGTTLRFDVTGGASALARPVCVDDALNLVDAIVAGAPHTATRAPTDVITLRGKGEHEVPPQNCAWVLVTGADGDAPVVVNLALAPTRSEGRPLAQRWVRVMLRAYDVQGGDAQLFGFTTGAPGAPRSLGRPLTATRSPSVWLVADPVELKNGVPLVVEVSAWKPRPPSLTTTKPTYDETPLGHATIMPVAGMPREERRAPLERDGHNVGWVDVALETMEVD